MYLDLTVVMSHRPMSLHERQCMYLQLLTIYKGLQCCVSQGLEKALFNKVAST